MAGSIGHKLSAGEAREHLLSQLLRDYLPARAAVSSGFVIDVHGSVSQQMDLVIYDVIYDAQYGQVVKVEGENFFPVETVVAVGEVKTDISGRQSLRDCLAKLASVKQLDRSAAGHAQVITGPGLHTAQIASFDPAGIIGIKCWDLLSRPERCRPRRP